MTEEVKCVCITATPVGANVKESDLKQTLQNTAKAVTESLDSFSDEVLASESEETKARNFLDEFSNYIKGESFKEKVNGIAQVKGIPPKVVAKNFFEKALGIIGDTLGIAINTVGNVGHTLVDILSTIAHGAVNLIVNVANALARVFTLNKTCIAC